MDDKNTVLIALVESGRAACGRIDFALQLPTQRVFSAVWSLESEVNNGGFHQFLFNCDSALIAFAPTALRTIGAHACATIVARAVRMLVPLPLTTAERRDALEALGDEGDECLAALDSEFYAYPDDLTALLLEFVREHRETFGDS